jgi:hypothetical protein
MQMKQRKSPSYNAPFFLSPAGQANRKADASEYAVEQKMVILPVVIGVPTP